MEDEIKMAAREMDFSEDASSLLTRLTDCLALQTKQQLREKSESVASVLQEHINKERTTMVTNVLEQLKQPLIIHLRDPALFSESFQSFEDSTCDSVCYNIDERAINEAIETADRGIDMWKTKRTSVVDQSVENIKQCISQMEDDFLLEVFELTKTFKELRMEVQQYMNIDTDL